MNFFVFSLFSFISCSLISVFYGNIDGWRGIIPLKSNKNQVEKLLGQAEQKDCKSCIYNTATERIVINYAESPCKGKLAGWNVSSDTVLTISVIPKKEKKFSELEINKVKLLAFSSDTAENFHVNQKAGIAYKVSPLGILERIDYMPSESDNALRCKGFFPYNPIGSMYHPTHSFAQTDLLIAKGTLDTFIIDLMNSSDKLKAYVIAYSGSNISEKQYKNLLAQLKEHVYKTRKVPLEAFEIIDGGNDNLFHIDIFIISKDFPPPVPFPKEP